MVFPAVFQLSSLNGTNGFALNGAGRSVSNAGDINGDGFDDLIIGNPSTISGAGKSYVVFGKSGGFGASFNLSTLNGTNGFAINGINAGDASGSSVSNAGDVNGDGFDDLIIGAPGPLPNPNSGQSYVVFGKSGGFNANFNLSTLNGNNGFAIDGFSPDDHFGQSVSDAGDVNGDGFDDLIIGAPYYGTEYSNGYSSRTYSGISQIILGNNRGNFTFNGIDANDLSGRSVSSAGDVNGDGFNDIIIGSVYADPNGRYDAGQSYVVFGRSSGFSANDLSTLNGTNGFAINGINDDDESGFSVSSAGDVNGDGFDDLIIGAPSADPNGDYSGQSYVIFGRSSGFSANFNLSTLNGTNGFAINGINAGDRSGFSVSSAGDVNGDGFDDLIIGKFNINSNSPKQSYVVFGKSGGFSANFNLFTLNGTNGFAINGADRDVSSAGDVNGDGVDDLIIGGAGTSYVIFGQRATTLPRITLAVSPSSVTENGTANLIYTFTRTGSLTSPLTVNFTRGGTATEGGDYQDYGDNGNTVTFAANSATARITVDPKGDTTVEANETVIFTLSPGTGYTIGTTTPVTGTITNDDSAPTLPRVTLAVSPTSVTENGTTNLIYTFTRTGSLTNPLTVNFTRGGTATEGGDYQDYGDNGNTVTFAANSATARITVDPKADTTFEPNETVIFTLSSGTGYTIGTTTPVTGTITNDDAAPRVTLAISPVSVTENGTTNLVYTFTRTGSLVNPLTANYTISGTATRGTDYANIGTSVTFAANSATARVTVDPTGDTTVEQNETVALTLASSSLYTIGTTGAVTGTILNDDGTSTLPRVTLAVSPTSVTEDGVTNLIYTFTRTGSLTSPLTVNFTQGGTATEGGDYQDYGENGNTVTFATNSSTARITVDPKADTTVEPNETVIFTLGSGSNYTIGTTTPVTGTITNDDSAFAQIATNSNDSLIFQSPNDRSDHILNFTPDDDLIIVSATGFGGRLTEGALLLSEQFTLGTSATTASQRFIYNNAIGALLFDSDGTGGIAAIQFATLNTGLALTNEDIFVS